MIKVSRFNMFKPLAFFSFIKCEIDYIVKKSLTKYIHSLLIILEIGTQGLNLSLFLNRL